MVVPHHTNFNVITESKNGFLSRKCRNFNLLECLIDSILVLSKNSKIYTMYTGLEKPFDSLTKKIANYVTY